MASRTNHRPLSPEELNEALKVQTRVCPVCRTVHDLPLCGERKPAETSEERSSARMWRVTGTKAGKLHTVIIPAKDHGAAVLKATKGKGLLLVVRDCVLVTA